MANNPKAPGKSAGNTFKPDEIEATLALFAAVQRGADKSTLQRLVRSVPLLAVNRKFLNMRASIFRQIEGARDDEG